MITSLLFQKVVQVLYSDLSWYVFNSLGGKRNMQEYDIGYPARCST